MVTRRDLLTGGAFGAFSSNVAAAPEQRGQADDERNLTALKDIRTSLDSIDGTLKTAFESNRVGFGFIPRIRELFTQFFRANFKFPDYMEIGTAVFYDLHDWHIKNNRQMEVSRVMENRLAIRFMFTLMVMRPEQDPGFLGLPYDR